MFGVESGKPLDESDIVKERRHRNVKYQAFSAPLFRIACRFRSGPMLACGRSRPFCEICSYSRPRMRNQNIIETVYFIQGMLYAKASSKACQSCGMSHASSIKYALFQSPFQSSSHHASRRTTACIILTHRSPRPPFHSSASLLHLHTSMQLSLDIEFLSKQCHHGPTSSLIE